MENIICEDSSVIPKFIFIIPYRDRSDHRDFFLRHMKYVLEDIPKELYAIYFIHQNDNRGFNRGAIKNIGFIWVKNKYPNNYKNITIVFNDIDVTPLTKNLIQYETIPGVVKHFYGFNYALGGILSINAADFERINGFPNYWGWGYEDNLLQRRVLNNNIVIDRSQFYDIFDKNFILLYHTRFREINNTDLNRYIKNTQEGIHSIKNIEYDVDEHLGYVIVNNFTTEYEENLKTIVNYDFINDSNPLKHLLKQKKPRMGLLF